MPIRAMAAAVVAAAGLTLAAAVPAAQAGTVQLTGVQLRAALLPAPAFPAGYKVIPRSASNSGKHLETGSAAYHLSTIGCTSFARNFGNKGFGETAVASDSVGPATSGTRGKIFGQQVYQFRTAAAAMAFFNGVRALARRCPGFALTGTAPGIKITTHAFNAAPIGGHRTFQVNQSANVFGRITLNLMFTVAGQDLFCTVGVGLNEAPPAVSLVRTLTLKLVNRVRAFR